jgi:hypothetical protein
MANTIPTAVSALGDAFECAVLDSSRVSKLSVASSAADAVHELGDTTTLITIYAAATIEVVRGDAWSAEKAWTLLAGYHPFNVPVEARTLRFRLPTGVSASAVVKILEN